MATLKRKIITNIGDMTKGNGDRLTKFHPCQQLQLNHTRNLNHEEIPTFDNFLVGNSDNNFSDTPANAPSNFDL